MQGGSERAVPSLSAVQWRQIVNSATDTAIISTDRDGRVTSWNAGAERLLGWHEAEMLGKTFERIFTEEDRARGLLQKEIADAIARGRGGGEEGWRLRKDGTRFWAVGEITPISSDDGVVGLVKVLRDRTAQRDSEQVLREERRTLEVLNRASSHLTRETDLRALVQIVTDAGVELSGAEFGAFFYNVLDESGGSYMLYTLSGAPMDAFSSFPMPRNTEVFGPTFRGEGIVRSGDITKDPRYGRNAPRSGMPEGHLPVRSYLAAPVIGHSGEVLGGLFFAHSKPNVFGERSERGLVALAAEAAVAMDNARLVENVQRELAERRRAEEALRDLNANLEQQVAERTEQLRERDEALRQAQKMEAIGQLTGGIAHDFNNLLQVITSSLEILQRVLPGDSVRLQRIVANAMTGARRAAALTQRLLAFSRRSPLDPKPIDVNALVGGMSDLLHRALGETISVETVQAAGLWLIEADPNQLEAAILNLAVNARDAMPEGGRMTIETSNAHLDEAYAAAHVELRAGQYVCVCVSDTGIGMNAEDMARAFEPFFTTKPVGKGTGLGLSQVYGFVKQSGGHVKLYSEVGEGTTVKMYFPRLIRAAVERNEAAALLPEGGNDEAILIVEDDEHVRALAAETLRELGYRVIEAGDGPAAINVLESDARIDLLFTDVVLPGGMTGAQIAARARELRGSGLKVLYTTGYARNAIFHHGRLDPGVQLITKPFDLSELATKVRDVIDGMA
jgi:PAS domain S-box-containing protein